MNKVIFFLFALTLGANIHATAQEAVNTSEIESIYAKAGFNYEHVNSMANQITQSEDPMAPGLAVSMLRTMESMKGAGAASNHGIYERCGCAGSHVRRVAE